MRRPAFFYLFFAILFSFITMIVFLLKIKEVHRQVDKGILYIPVIGKIIKEVNITH